MALHGLQELALALEILSKKANETGHTIIRKGATRARPFEAMSRPFDYAEIHDNDQSACSGNAANDATNDCPERG